jgi:mannan endo-1,4-beta-mannosidase
MLTAGMRDAQHNLAGFLERVDWTDFRRRNLNREITVSSPSLAVFGCGDAQQAIVWLLRQDALRAGKIDPAAKPVQARLTVPGLVEGRYAIHFWDTTTGAVAVRRQLQKNAGAELEFEVPPVRADLALALVKER